ncbi:sigma-54-dependent Fis family transcriptional regulator [Vibrio anguillarum]|uniref:Sigma-54-dependent Fis family transcriptional regulator n=1 Tax=Vibrio anguillarum TaxID=55601 RepID=A0A289GB04_VIBAN|nr:MULTISPECIES: sigma-54 dependent transcriptional regulator [Vibrio]ASW80705.1 sigma-54-dependent Fis family transcriptional regulator [Vibrio anguillarum]AXN04279.1 sigma-54-dependent Fis family transcriptional regulator [Vibrio anguillarum]AZS25911.1 sigma-54-dependent Fis family transcriptional regulator [Vibrio anguillarum]MBF4308793.1 sigma-54-dependent Fis family transcriptional regulator [Vibrio anguillarum]MBF4324465.1 sigma-54-dependent Fis family transcriptional regulator [Vibrio a
MCDVFFIDDEADIRIAIAQSFELADLTARLFSSAEEALLAAKADGLPLVVVSDICLPGLSGQSLLNSIHHQDAEVPVILITGHGDISMAVQAMHDGAYDFIEKPFATERLIETIHRAIEKRHLTLENQQLKRSLKASQTLGPRIIGNTGNIQALRDTITHVADTQADILLFGETGTGKELVARSLHEQSSRRELNFVALNCGAVPENLIESELYGHEKGAFTGAETKRIGKFEHAQGGTLFLDEIESMPMQAQIRLLRVLQERVIERVGSNTLIPLDIRVIAATKVDLKQAAQAGTFRQDLYYRLNIVTLDIPPLRQRKEDIPALFHHFLLVAAARYGKAATALSQPEMQRLISHDWPGNVRELRNAAERYVLLGKLAQLGDNEPSQKLPTHLVDQVAEFEKSVIEQALIECGGRINETMERLNVPRKTLYDKMQRYGLDKELYKI